MEPGVSSNLTKRFLFDGYVALCSIIILSILYLIEFLYNLYQTIKLIFTNKQYNIAI